MAWKLVLLAFVQTVLVAAHGLGVAYPSRRLMQDMEPATEIVMPDQKLYTISRLDSRLVFALEQEDSLAQKKLISAGASTDTRDKDGETSLHDAAERGDMDMVDYLLDSGAYLDSEDKTGATPLHEASLFGRADVVVELLSAGAHPDASDMSNQTAMHYAAFVGHADVMVSLLSHGANIDARDAYGRTALWISVFNGRLTPVTMLIEEGADPNIEGRMAQDPEELMRTPLKLAKQRKYAKVAETLKTAGNTTCTQSMV